MGSTAHLTVLNTILERAKLEKKKKNHWNISAIVFPESKESPFPKSIIIIIFKYSSISQSHPPPPPCYCSASTESAALTLVLALTFALALALVPTSSAPTGEEADKV
ncbi:hypothetical protein Bca4012_086597 [Brassica carinata]|uniref:Uncharacterized protein n=1 Tax=Brassica carinata TaxID=52824 RepID=A0A8X7TIT1_BRACI|nr:hypothetical protein Bca52824_094769 [Brassica carinata]